MTMKTATLAMILTLMSNSSWASNDTILVEDTDVPINAQTFDKKEMMSPVNVTRQISRSVATKITIPGWDTKIAEASHKAVEK